MEERRTPFTPAVLAAFAIVYLVWGSTYLAIRIAVESIPPLLMSGLRFLIAGAAVLLWCALRRRVREGWFSSQDLLGGFLLIAATYGLIAWGELRITSAVAAIIGASVPIWICVGEALLGERPARVLLIGVAVGFAGQVVLLFPELRAAERGDAVALGAIMLSSVTWAAGTLLLARRSAPSDLLRSTGAQMLVGGALLVAAGLAVGEARDVHPDRIELRSWIAWSYLTIAGSIVAYPAYVWLLGRASATHVGTTAYVNPIVAVIVGAAIGGERIGASVVIALTLVVGAVFLISRPRRTPG